MRRKRAGQLLRWGEWALGSARTRRRYVASTVGPASVKPNVKKFRTPYRIDDLTLVGQAAALAIGTPGSHDRDGDDSGLVECFARDDLRRTDPAAGRFAWPKRHARSAPSAAPLACCS